MVLGVVATTRGRGTSQGTRIYYHDTGGSNYLFVSHLRLIIYVTNERACLSL